MKVITFNANGIRAAQKRGFYQWLDAQEMDFLCLQEVKAQRQALDDSYLLENYFCDFAEADKKGYSGVAIYARKPPINCVKTLNFPWADREGRYLQFDYPNLSVISLYLPSGTKGPERQQVKYQCLAYFMEHFIQLKQQKRELIFCGDYNIAHKKIDVANWQANQTKPGFLPEERQWMSQLFDNLELVDAFRRVNQTANQYTWWSYRHPNAWLNNKGWRLDYQITTKNLANAIIDASIFTEKRFSDHAPLVVDYQGTWDD